MSAVKLLYNKDVLGRRYRLPIVLYSTGCPKCRILEKKLEQKQVDFTLGNIQEVVDLGYLSAPVLKVDNDYLDFSQAVKYLQERR